MPTPNDKRRWYERGEPSPEEEPVLTKRDLSILLNLYSNRFMSTRQLQVLHGECVFRRLKRLFEHGYIDRPRAQRIWRLREGGGSHPGIYAIANRGVRALVAVKLIDDDRRDFSERNCELSAVSLKIPHELGVADVAIYFRRVCEEYGLYLLDDGSRARGRAARALVVPGEDTLLYPDLITVIERDGEPAAYANLFFIELDRVTEPNERFSSEELQSLGRKYESYLTYARAKGHMEQFGITNFRVLTITTGGETKVRNVAETAYRVCEGVGCGRFLATSFNRLKAYADTLAVPWIAADGVTMRLEL